MSEQPRPAGVGKQQVWDAISVVQDPELRLGIVELGLVYDVELANDDREVTVKMTLTSPMCPVGPMLMNAVHENVAMLPGVENVSVELVWDPPWDPRIMASDEVKDALGIW